MNAFWAGTRSQRGSAGGVGTGVGIGSSVGDGDGLSAPTGDGEDNEDGLANADIGESDAGGEGTAPLVQPPRSASDVSPTANLVAKSFGGFTMLLRDACAQVAAVRCVGLDAPRPSNVTALDAVAPLRPADGSHPRSLPTPLPLRDAGAPPLGSAVG